MCVDTFTNTYWDGFIKPASNRMDSVSNACYVLYVFIVYDLFMIRPNDLCGFVCGCLLVGASSIAFVMPASLAGVMFDVSSRFRVEQRGRIFRDCVGEGIV